jgi:hypothetical protein
MPTGDELKESQETQPVDDGQQQDFEAMFDALPETVGKPDRTGSELDEEKEEVVVAPSPEDSGTEDQPAHGEQEQTDPVAELRQELAHLKAELTAQRELPKQEQVAQPDLKEEEIPDDIKDLYEDFPAFQKAAQFEAQRLLNQVLPQMIEAKFGGINPANLVEQINFERFKADVVNGFYDETGAFVEGVPDAVKITNDPGYWKWFEAKGYQPGDQKVAVKVLNQYKAELAAKAATEKQNQGKERVGRLNEAYSETIESGNRSSRGAGVKKDLNNMSFEDAFDEVVQETAAPH